MKVNREELLGKLQRIKVGVASKQIVEQSACFVFKDGRIFTFNDEIAASCPFDADFAGAVPSDELLALLSKLKGEEVSVEIGEQELSVSSARSRAGIRIEQDIRLPLDSIGAVGKFKSFTAELAGAIKLVAPYACRNLSRPALANIHVSSGTVEACDGFQLARVGLTEPVSKPYLIPVSVVDEVLAIAPIKYSVKDNWVHFEDENDLRISVRVFEGEFPDLENLVRDDGSSREVNFSANAFDSIDRAKIFSSQQFEQDEQLEVTFKDGKMLIRSQNDKGWIEEEARTRFKGELRFLVHPALLETALKKSNTVRLFDDRMRIEDGAAIYIVSLIGEE